MQLCGLQCVSLALVCHAQQSTHGCRSSGLQSSCPCYVLEHSWPQVGRLDGGYTASTPWYKDLNLFLFQQGIYGRKSVRASAVLGEAPSVSPTLGSWIRESVKSSPKYCLCNKSPDGATWWITVVFGGAGQRSKDCNWGSLKHSDKM